MSTITLRLLLVSIIVNNTAVDILRAVSLHNPLADPSIIPRNKVS
jgi:hypothetical protein